MKNKSTKYLKKIAFKYSNTHCYLLWSSSYSKIILSEIPLNNPLPSHSFELLNIWKKMFFSKIHLEKKKFDFVMILWRKVRVTNQHNSPRISMLIWHKQFFLQSPPLFMHSELHFSVHLGKASTALCFLIPTGARQKPEVLKLRRHWQAAASNKWHLLAGMKQPATERTELPLWERVMSISHPQPPLLSSTQELTLT